MKKFFVALCGLLVINDALAHPDRYHTPEPVNATLASTWKTSGTYNSGLPNGDGAENVYESQFLNKYICHKDKGTKKTSNQSSACLVTHDNTYGIGGTYDDEGAILLDIAQKIYQNGATFCPTQVQVANIDSREYVWIDYYSDNTTMGCKTYCKPGYDPDNECEPYTGTRCDDSAGYPFTIKNRTILKAGGATGNFTGTMPVFSYKNETGSGTSNKPAGAQMTEHIVLGIISKDSADGNGIKVAPIKITGKRDKTASGGIQSWIYDVKYNDNNFTVLCPQGYVPNTQNKCELVASCQETNRTMCTGYTTGYDSDIHDMRQTDNECWEYRCKQDGYGFKSSTDKTCYQCVTSKRTGIKSNGECETCDVGQCFSRQAQQCGNCRHNPSKLEMLRGPNYQTQNKQCWRKTNLHEFWGCVLCSNDDECWYNDGGCKRCE